MRYFISRDKFPYIFSLIYLIFNSFFISKCFAITHDSIYYLDALLERPFELFPHHLLFLPFVSILSNIIMSLGVNSKAVAASIVNLLAGSITLFIIYNILIKNFRFDRIAARITVLFCAFSYGFWFYNLNIETYILPLPFLFTSIYFLTRNQQTNLSLLVAAVFGGIAVLFHQLHGLYGVVVVIFLLLQNNQGKIRKLLVFVFVFNLIWIAGYIIAILAIGLKTLEEIFHWFFLYHFTMNAWSKVSLVLFIAPFIGLVRSFVSIQGLFINNKLATKLFQLFPDNSLFDDAFLVRNLSEFYFYIYIILILVVFILFVFLLISNLKQFKGVRLTDDNLHFFLIFLITYSLFFTFWVPTNLEFWIPQSMFIWFIFGATFRKDNITKKKILFNVLLLISIVVLNFRFTILLSKEITNDYYYEEVTHIKNNLPPNSIVLYDHEWIVSKYYKLYAPEIIFMSYYDPYGKTLINNIRVLIETSINNNQSIAIKANLINDTDLMNLSYKLITRNNKYEETKFLVFKALHK